MTNESRSACFVVERHFHARASGSKYNGKIRIGIFENSNDRKINGGSEQTEEKVEITMTFDGKG